MQTYDYRHKLILSGNIAELYTYRGGFFRRTSGSTRKPRCNTDLEEITERAQEYISRSSHRARSLIKRLIYTNFDTPNTYFLTLTFNDDIIDFDSTSILDADNYFSRFRKRFARLVPDVRWVCVPEYQKRGAVHYHLLTDTKLKPTEKNNFKAKEKLYYNANINGVDLSELWGGGYVGVQPVAGDILQTSQYISKYMRKGRSDRIGRSYRTTQNLTRPTVLYTNGGRLDDYGLHRQEPVFTKFYDDKGGAIVQYDVFKLLQV